MEEYRALIKLAGVTLGKRKSVAKRQKVQVKEKKPKHTMVRQTGKNLTWMNNDYSACYYQPTKYVYNVGQSSGVLLLCKL